MATSLDDLVTPITVEEFKTSIYSALETMGATTTNWKPGAVVRTIIAIVAIMLAALSLLSSEIARSGFLDTATKDWLTLLARYVYGVTRIDATFASGNVTFNNSSGAVYALDPGDIIVKASSTGKTYTNTEAVVIGALATNVVVAMQATEAGSPSTAYIGDIDTMVTTFTGVTVTNTETLIGADTEEDEPLRIRCRAKLGALSPNGPADAYYYFATTAVRLDGTPIGVTRVSKAYPDGLGGFDMYVANAGGSITGTIGNTATDLGKVDDDIQIKAVPLGATARIHTATPRPIDVTYEVWLYNTVGLSELEIQAAIEAELVTFLSSRPIGGDVDALPPGKVFKSALSAVIGRSRSSSGASLGIFRVELSVPASDYTIAVNEAPILGNLICTSIHQMPL